MGFSPERVLRRAGLPPWHFCEPDDLIPYRDYHIFMQYAARATGTETFGLRAAASKSFESIGTFGTVVARSLTVNHLLGTVCRVIPCHNSGSSFWLAEDGDGLWLCRRPVEIFDAGRRQTEQYALMQMIKAVRLGAGPGWVPARIALLSDPQPALDETKALAGAEIRYRQEATAIAIPRAMLARAIGRRPDNAGASDKKLLGRLNGTAPASDFAGSVRQVAGTLLREGTPQIETVAEIAGLPVRSLQRRLRAEGHSYSGLVGQARYLAARDLLQGSEIKITEIALDVGYSDAAHFNRAFRRWAGITPREFRRQRLYA
ncbi:MAG: AraC family transcriptional regulator [Rhodospirillales bacterium]|nr:AraC family transcriptional regulator [Rhodospirillales bacterium]MDH3790118.1 AraC family transcriptional regulator [Rhodospirillales bacterium]MDH3918728.1 AraC family transcriptional regulator [Rhodospirillales bacterium]MDH3968507.1 AraC family transcriptional regulator [Rhodospirillales bacterium]